MGPLLVLAVLLAAGVDSGPRAGAGATTGERFRIVPGPYLKKGSDAPAPSTARVVVRGVALSVEHLEPAERAAFIHAINPNARDPFAAPPGEPERYNAFRVELDNQSSGDMTFQPGNTLLMTERGDQQGPIDLTDVYRYAALAEVGDPQAVMDRTAPFIFDLSTTIPQGGRLARLLIFGSLPARWKQLNLLFSFLQIGKESPSVSIPFHRQAIPDQAGR
jgi:hypothetical protein